MRKIWSLQHDALLCFVTSCHTVHVSWHDLKKQSSPGDHNNYKVHNFLLCKIPVYREGKKESTLSVLIKGLRPPQKQPFSPVMMITMMMQRFVRTDSLHLLQNGILHTVNKILQDQSRLNPTPTQALCYQRPCCAIWKCLEVCVCL